MGSFAKSRTIRHIVRLRQMLRCWKARACGGVPATIPADVPAGHVAVRVGSTSRRFVVRTAYLSHPIFRKLLRRAEEEYGFDHAGPLSIPCDEAVFEQILRYLSSPNAPINDIQPVKGSCHLGGRGAWGDSRPLLHGLVEDSPVW